MPESAPQDVNQTGLLSPGMAPPQGSVSSPGMAPPQGSALSTTNISSAQLLAQRRQRLTSAKYYDIASTLLGGDTDLDELFVAAARDGDYDKIEHFLQGRTDIIVSVDVKDRQTGNTALIWAAKKGHIRIVHLLLKHGADPTLHNYKDQTAVEVATPSIKTVLLDSVEKSTESPHRLLLQAAWQGNVKVVHKLLKENKVIDINCQNAEGLTPLLLLTRDIQLFEKITTHLHRPYSPLHVLQELLTHRADVHATDGDDKTCLHHASQSKATLAQAIVSCLISRGSEMDVRDKRHFMPIHCASKSGNTNVVEALVEGGSEVNSRGYAGLTPLHITAYNDHHQTAKSLLQHGADVTLTDDSGLRAVDLAKSRKMKTTLKEAWTEANDKKQPTNLSPVRAPSREQSRMSAEGINKKRKGEVIFDGLQINAYPSEGSSGQRPVLSRTLSNAEKARKAEQQMLREIEAGRFTPTPKENVRRLGQLRNKPPPLPQLSQSSVIPSSPDSLSPRTPGHPRQADDLRRSLEDGRHIGQKGRMALLSTSSSGLNSCRDKDVNFCIQNNREHSHIILEGGQLLKKHHRSGSDPFTASFGDVALSCEQYLSKKARSRSTSSQDDYDEDPLKMLPYERELTCLNIPSTIPEINSPRVQAVIVDSEEQPTTSTVISIYPNSSRVLPPTPVPTFLTQKSFNLLDGKLIRHQDKEQSPRSNDELPKISHDPVKAINGTNLLRSHTIFKEEFILEESRPKDPLLQSSGSDPMSSASSLSSSSPRDTANIVLVHKNSAKSAKGRISPLIKCDRKRVGVSEKSSDSGQPSGVKTRTKVGRSQSFTTSESKSSASGRKYSAPENNTEQTAEASTPSPSGVEGSEPTASVKFSRSDSELNKKIQGLVPQSGRTRQAKGKNLTPPATAVVSQNGKNTSGVKNTGLKSSVTDKTKPSNVSTSVGKSSDTTKPSNVSASVGKSSDNTKPSNVSASVSKSSDNTKPSNVIASVGKSSNNTKHPNVGASVNKSSNPKTSDIMDKKNNPDRKCVSSENMVDEVNQGQKNDVKTEEDSNTQNTAKSVCTSQSLSKPSSCVSSVKSTQNTSTSNKKLVASKTARMTTSTNQNKTKFLKAFSASSTVTATGLVKSVTSKSTEQSSAEKKTTEENTDLTSPPVSASKRESVSSKTSKTSSMVSKTSVINKENFGSVSKSSPGGPVPRTNSNLQVSTSGLDSVPVPRTNSNLQVSTSGLDNVLITKTKSNLQVSSSGIDSVQVAKTNSSLAVPKCDVGVVTAATTTPVKNNPVTSSATSPVLNSPNTVTQTSKLSASSEHLQPKTSTHGPSLSHKTSAPKSKLFESVKKSASSLRSSNSASIQGKNTKSSATSVPNVTVSHPLPKSDNLKSSDHQIPLKSGPVCAVKVNRQEAALANTKASDKTYLKPQMSNGFSNQYDNVKSQLVSTPKEPLVKIICHGEEAKPKIPNISAVTPFPSQTIQTPLIVNPFEDMIVPEYSPVAKPVKNTATAHSNYKGVSATSFGYVVGKSSKDATCKLKSQTKYRNIKSAKKSQNNKDLKRPQSGHRQPSARRRGGKTKLGEQDEGNKVKSARGKRVRSARRKKPEPETAALAENALNPDVALITGIGWHVATNCFDTSDVKVATILGSTDSEDSDVELINAEVPKSKVAPKLTERSASPGTPRFQEVKIKQGQKSSLPAMTNDGFPPMNLDMTQKPCPEVRITEASCSSVSKKANSNTKENKFASPFDDITNQVHKEIMLQKLSTIPQSPSLANSTDLAINHFDQMVKGDQLDKLLGISPGESVSSCHSTTIKQGLRNEAPSGKRHSSRKKKAEGAISPGHQTVTPVSEGKLSASQILNADKHTLLEPEVDREPTDAEITKIIEKYANLKHTNRLRHSRRRRDSIDSDDFYSHRSERKFSETKKAPHDSDSEIDEAIEEILNSTVGTSTHNSTLKSNRTVRSLNNTLTEADHNVLLKLKQSDSVFHAKQSDKDDAKQSDDDDDVLHAKQSEQEDDDVFRSKHSDLDNVCCSDTYVDETNPHLLKLFHDDDFHMGAKVKAMIDAGADTSRVKEMMNADEEQKQLEKVMNCVRNMELQATMSSTSGRIGSQGTPRRAPLRPEQSTESPRRNNMSGRNGSQATPHKAPLRPEQSIESPHRSKKPVSCHGLPPVGNKFLELKKGSVHKGKTTQEQEETSPRIGNKEVAVLEAISKEIVINPSEGETMRSHLRGRRGSRTSSAGTIDSLQSDADETIEWKKGNVLGRGAFGVVWCGLTNEGGLIAVKQIELNAADHSKAQREYEKVQEEVELLKNLRHKNIVGYLGTSFENDIVSIFMQFVPGGSIASILARFGALDESVFRRYTKQILEGVEYLHENDIIHRDIKGGNVMLMPNGVIKLIDFGCAKRLCINLSLSQSQILKSMKGTPYWMAPEVVNETGHGKKSDIWSVGCTVFEMATKKPPWANVNPMAAIFAIGSDKPIPPLPELFSDEARHFVKCCLTRDQSRRSSASELLEHPFILKKPSSRK
ncbi:uncharacterized protein LOC121380819 [Gigantopelta aegis]|uniref:uncharacterized protein LOC121380819 n=1 Tax=Gigantopelta aegis TaxID=1735272 RepID=UPI001B88CACB|nr:uncharacterized protein LOC121380819 [Gigantopelta aegis]